MPRQFSWIDQRLVRDKYLCHCKPPALALYLFLVTVADARGLSYYADHTLSEWLSLDARALQRAREQLQHIGLIAYDKPLYQVLALDGSPTSPPAAAALAPPAVAQCIATQRQCPDRPIAAIELLHKALERAS